MQAKLLKSVSDLHVLLSDIVAMG